MFRNFLKPSFCVKFYSKFQEYPDILRNSINTFRTSFQKPENQHSVLSAPIKMIETLTHEEKLNLEPKDEFKSIFYELFRCLQEAKFPKDSMESVDTLVMNLYRSIKDLDQTSEFFLDIEMYNLILETFAILKSDSFFNVVILDMKENQVPIDQDTFKMMIKLAVNQRDYQKALKICNVMKKMGFDVDESIRSLIGQNPFQF
jgi:pentatricopeptide repeat protein